MASWLLSRLLYKSLDEDDLASSDNSAEVLDLNTLDPNYLHDPATVIDEETLKEILQSPQAMGSLEKLISESYKFIRMADDLHDVASYLNDMRLCFIIITATGHLILFVYLIMLCMRRNRRNQPRRRNWDYQLENQGNFQTPAVQNNTDDLTSVRTEANNSTSYMGRNHHSRTHTNAAPSFMRHGHMNHQQQTTRLMAEQDGAVVKHHQIPHITTDPPGDEKASSKVPQLVKDSIDT